MKANELEQMTTTQLVEYLTEKGTTTDAETELLSRLTTAMDEIDVLHHNVLTLEAAGAQAALRQAGAPDGVDA